MMETRHVGFLRRPELARIKLLQHTTNRATPYIHELVPERLEDRLPNLKLSPSAATYMLAIVVGIAMPVYAFSLKLKFSNSSGWLAPTKFGGALIGMFATCPTN